MQWFPKVLGYLGVLPFLGFAGATLFQQDSYSHLMMMGFAAGQVIYGAMIISFLGGTHWVKALAADDKIRLTLSMTPTILSLGVLVVLLKTLSGFIPLILMAVLFVAVHIADRCYSKNDDWPQGYLNFRLSLTILVSLILLTHAGALYVL